MGFLSALGSIGKAALGFVPGGNIANGIIDGIGAVGGVAGAAAKGSADQRIAETPGQVGAYRANLEGMQLQDKRAALASLLGGGLQDTQIQMPQGSTIPQFNITGGLRPSAMNQSALLAQLGQKIDPLELPKAGLGEKILGGVGLGGSLLGALGKIGQGQPQQSRNLGFDRLASGSGVLQLPGGPAEMPPPAPKTASAFVDPKTYGGQRHPLAMY